MSFTNDKYRVVVASDVNTRDGIGVEIYEGDNLLIEIFRDDTARTREITTYRDVFSLEDMERFIQIFRDKISWNFIEYED